MKSLLKNWNTVKNHIKRYRYVLLCLDYDGTLTSIVRSPKRALLADTTRRLLDKLSHEPRYIVCIVSGRSLKDVKKLVGLEGLIYAGNHGLELEVPRLRFVIPRASETKPLLKRIADKLGSELRDIPGSSVEDKGLSLSVHFRCVRRGDLQRVKLIFEEITRPYLLRGEIRIAGGKKVFEVRPPISWNKGKVVTWLLKRPAIMGKTEITLPIYVGDDLTDEDAFRALLGTGITVYVGRPNTSSKAEYYLANVREVKSFLRKLADLK